MRAMQLLLSDLCILQTLDMHWCCHMREVCLQPLAHLRQAPLKTEACSACRLELMAESRGTGDGPTVLQQISTEDIAAGCSGMV